MSNCPPGVTAPPDEHPHADLALDCELAITRAFRKAEPAVKGLSVGSVKFVAEVEPAGSDKLQVYAPLFLRLTVPAYGDPNDVADELLDAIERLVTEARYALKRR